MDAEFTAYLEQVRAHRSELKESLAELEEALLAPIGLGPEKWRERVLAAVREVEADFGHHVELTEAPGGLYEDIKTSAPRLSNKVQALLDEHDKVTAAAAAMVDKIEHADPATDLGALRDETTDFMNAVGKHRQRGSDLVYEAYVVDLGGLG